MSREGSQLNEIYRQQYVSVGNTQNCVVNDLTGLKVELVKNEMCFFSLLDECGPGGFYHNRTDLLKGYFKGLLYTVAGIPEPGTCDDKIWARFNKNITARYYTDSTWERAQILPCFCLLSEETDYSSCDILWVHPRIRKQGVATMMLDTLKVKHANNKLPESDSFWHKYFQRFSREEQWKIIVSYIFRDDDNN